MRDKVGLLLNCPECTRWQVVQGPYAKCFDCAVKAVEEGLAEKRAAQDAPKERAKPKPINHRPIKRAVKPRPKS